MRDFLAKNYKWVIPILIVVVIGIMVKGNLDSRKESDRQSEADKLTQELLQQAQSGQGSEEDSLLMMMQPELVKTYGKVPEGFIWEADGTVLSLGDKSMSAEDVVYAYFRGLSSLDMGTVERYSRNSSVVGTYSGYFDEADKSTDYLDNFIRNMYKQCLLSIQIEGIKDVSVFAENKQVFTVKAKMLNLTDKDFWKDEKLDIFRNLYIYDSDESDSTKSDIYLYDYILNHYESENAKLRDVVFNVTLQRYPDLDSGWLVSVDTDIDYACQYKDGNLVISYIRDLYTEEGRDLVLKEREKGK